MRFPRIAVCLLALSAACAAFSVSPRSANAQTVAQLIPKTYQVQVQYWFFDTDYYYWSTVFESSSQSDAQFVYNLLEAAHDDGNLNQVAPNSYWRYIAVDVRMITVYHYPRVQRRFVNNASPWRKLD